MDDDLKRLLDGMQQENTAAHVETRRHFDVTAERLEKKMEAIAESVANVDEKLDRKTKTSRSGWSVASPIPRR
ncbi:MAG: hypothetical protein M3P29_00735 [Acidobacteriota bacterium]|nr:hypothetical protein [Acidobacteriota bacterium]